jgi:hypothetical protein
MRKEARALRAEGVPPDVRVEVEGSVGEVVAAGEGAV